MSDEANDCTSVSARERDRARLARDVEIYLANGGRITVLPSFMRSDGEPLPITAEGVAMQQAAARRAQVARERRRRGLEAMQRKARGDA